MRRPSALAYLSGAIALAAAFGLYQELQFMGFPDGFLTELDRARKVLFRIFIGVSIPVALWLFTLGRLAASRQVGRLLMVSLAGYGAFIALLFITDLYLRQNLRGGGGG